METKERGTITELDADGVGRIACEDGSVLRFGQSACVGFDPIAGADVMVEAIGPHPLGGMRATRVTIAPDGLERLDALHDRRATERGLGTPSSHEANGAALAIGTITVLLRSAPEPGTSGVRQLFERAGIQEGTELASQDGAPRYGLHPRPVLHLAGRSLQTFVGRAPFDAETLDVTAFEGASDLGRGFVSFSIGLAQLELQARLLRGARYPDPWGPTGIARGLTALALGFADLAAGVVLHRAGHVAIPMGEWIDSLGAFPDPSARPFRAWIDIAFTPDERAIRAEGMTVLALEDPLVDVTGHGDEDLEIAQDVLLAACERMVRENRPLGPGEEVRVGDARYVLSAERGPVLVRVEA
ncbi:MAG: hypothetical protein AB7S26_25030 [Sandaracinaceae bacterium]